jgi:N-acetylglucosamine-6-phosphate deacetylase
MGKHNHNASVVEGIHYATGKPVTIEICEGIIEKISGATNLSGADNCMFIAPGLIDNQINGYAGIDFTGDNLTEGDLTKAAKAVLKEGVTTFFPTLITSIYSKLLSNLKILNHALENDEMFRASVPGFHLEGPYISPEDGFRGCHPKEYIRKPSVEEFIELQAASGNNIIQITLAPEAEGAMELIRYCVSEGVVVAMGHTNATAAQIRMAADNGVRLSTHLGNGCANIIHRHNNPLWPQLADNRLTPSVIADGLHLLPEEINVIYKVKGAGNMILTSDIVYLAGMEPGRYSYLGTEVMLTDSGMLMDVRNNCLAGASFPLKKGIETMMTFTGCSLEEAVDMASGNVARIYNLSDRGSIDAGKRADLILFEMNGNEINIRKTYLKGQLVYNYHPLFTLGADGAKPSP